MSDQESSTQKLTSEERDRAIKDVRQTPDFLKFFIMAVSGGDEKALEAVLAIDEQILIPHQQKSNS